MSCTEGRKYAERSGIECPICMEIYESTKILPCKHEICSQCLYLLLSEGNLLCPHCRTVFDRDSDFKTRESWNLECFSCFELKPSKEFNWCVNCAQLLCCLCLCRQHTSSNHTIQEWDSGVPVIAALKSKYILEVEDYPRQQLLLKERILKLIEPVAESISKDIIESRHQEATNLLETFSISTENLEKLAPNTNGQEALCIAAKVNGIKTKDLLHVPDSLKNQASIKHNFRSLMNFGSEPNFFDNKRDSENQNPAMSENLEPSPSENQEPVPPENQELAPSENQEPASPTLSTKVPFKIKAEQINRVRISLSHRKILYNHDNLKPTIFDLNIFNGQKFHPEILDRSHGTELRSGRMMKKNAWDGIFDPVQKEYYSLEWDDQADCFNLSVIDLDLMTQTCLWSSARRLYGRGYIQSSPSGVLFLVLHKQDDIGYRNWKTSIISAQRNETGTTKEIVRSFNFNDLLFDPVCYEVGSDTFLIAYDRNTRQACLYRYDGPEMPLVRRIKNHPLFRDPSGRTLQFGNCFIKISPNQRKLKAFTRDGHAFQTTWEFERPNTEIMDIAMDGDRLLMALYKEKDECVQFKWFSFAELKENYSLAFRRKVFFWLMIFALVITFLYQALFWKLIESYDEWAERERRRACHECLKNARSTYAENLCFGTLCRTITNFNFQDLE